MTAPLKPKKPKKERKYHKITGQTGPKLTGEKEKIRPEIIKLLALGYSAPLVVQELKDNYGITVCQQNIINNYKKKRAKIIEMYRQHMAKEVMKHPLADKRTRLNYLLKGLNHALTWSTDKLYFDKFGDQIGEIKSVKVGVISQLIKEAREEIEGVKPPGVEVKVSLLQIIKEVSAHERGFDVTTKAKVDRGLQAPPDQLDKPRPGDIRIL